MTAQLDALQAQVAANSDVVNSAVALLGALKADLDAAIQANEDGDDGAALQALSDKLGADDKSLADAIAANTPASSTPSTPVETPPADTGSTAPTDGSTDTPTPTDQTNESGDAPISGSVSGNVPG